MYVLLDEVHGLYRELTLELIKQGLTIATMESCTSGLVASLISDTEGASSVLAGGYVTYCNAAKEAAGVPAKVIDTYGVYSQQTAQQMATAARKGLGTRIGIGVTGTFSNSDPANRDSVPGMVWFAIDMDGEVSCTKLEIPGDGQDRFTYKLITARRIAQELRKRL
jgi:PncC family amidohydrolase